MDVTIKRVRDSFITELLTEGDNWRIMRPATLIDLLKLTLERYKKGDNETYLVEIFNTVMKLKLAGKLDAIELNKDLEKTSQNLNKESELIIRAYDSVVETLRETFHIPSTANAYDLSAEINYLKVAYDLDHKSDLEAHFDNILSITYNLIRAQ